MSAREEKAVRALDELCKEALGRRAVPKPVQAFAAALAARHGRADPWVLFYGSCLRTGVLEDRILDFHVLVSAYRPAYPGRPLLAAANALFAPNVFFAAGPDRENAPGPPLRAKYNVVSRPQLRRLVAPSTRQVWFWARFAQPMALAFPDKDRAPVLTAVSRLQRQALMTLLGAFLPLAADGADAEEVFSGAFEQTYACEPRAEPAGKGREIYALDKPYYDRLFAPALAALGWPAMEDPAAAGGVRILAADPALAAAEKRRWRRRRRVSRTLALLRLAKSAFTFSGGADYIAWKIRRHAGVEVELSAFDRRHPLLAGLRHYWRLKRMGGFR